MNTKILCVDDDPNILTGYQRSLRKQFTLETAPGGEAALAQLAKNGPYAVIVADMQMPGMNGVQLLSKVQEKYPDTVRIMLTGNADQHTAVQAVNKGHVFQFLTKPCEAEMLALALQAGLKQHGLITAERELLENTLNGSVKVLTDVLSMVDPDSFGRGETLREYMRAYVSTLNTDRAWEFEIAAMLSQIGAVTIPLAVIEKFRAGRELTETEQDILSRVPKTGADLIANIPRLESVSKIVLYQHKHYDGSGFPNDSVRGEDIPVGSRILKILIDLLELEAKKVPKDAALNLMQHRMGWYDPRILDATFACFDIYLPDTSAKSQGQPVTAKELRVGHVLLADVRTENGRLVVPARTRISPILLVRLTNFAKFSPVVEPIYVEHQAQHVAA
jgi:response regulator RpfG family c-di-GMP phosphodiesterase